MSGNISAAHLDTEIPVYCVGGPLYVKGIFQTAKPASFSLPLIIQYAHRGSGRLGQGGGQLTP